MYNIENYRQNCKRYVEIITYCAFSAKNINFFHFTNKKKILVQDKSYPQKVKLLLFLTISRDNFLYFWTVKPYILHR